jgi:hypothetical protein
VGPATPVVQLYGDLDTIARSLTLFHRLHIGEGSILDARR